MKRLASPTGKAVVLPAVRPNAGTRALYQKQLEAMLDAMHRDVLREVERTWRQNRPEMAQDESPAAALLKAMRGLGRKWLGLFDEAAPKLARYFADDVKDRTDGALAKILRDAGFTVQFKMSPRVNDVFQATVGEQVGLIKSIAQQHLAGVQGAVMRSVQTGRDLGSLSKELREQYGVSKRRAAFISRDQSNKATATITRARQQELGISRAIWMHSHGGKTPRPEHVAADGKVYDVAKGMWLEGRWTWPGVEINCRCVSRAVIPGFD